MTEAATRPTPGTPCWVSLIVHDLAASKEFYRELFGWGFRDGPPQLGAQVQAAVDGGGRLVAGLGEMSPGPHAHRLVAWLPYLATDDADTTATLVRDCGGTLAVGPLEAGRDGRMAIAADVSGAAFGLWQPGTFPGTPFHSAEGAPVWTTLITPETSAVAKFYTMLFGYDAQAEPGHLPGGDHLTLRLAGRPVASIDGVGPAVPHDRGPHWLTFFAVADVDSAVRRLTELGGRVLSTPTDTPFGRQAQVADPEGALFGLVSPVPA